MGRDRLLIPFKARSPKMNNLISKSLKPRLVRAVFVFSTLLAPLTTWGQVTIPAQKPEDAYRIPSTPWVVFSEIARYHNPARPGNLRLLDIRSPQDPAVFYPKTNTPDSVTDPASFSPVGINGRFLDGKGHFELLVTDINKVNGNGVLRFKLQLRGGKPPQILRVERVQAPPGTMLNSVAPLPDGGFVVTNAYDIADPFDFTVGLEEAIKKFDAALPTGSLWRWSSNTGWKQWATPPISWYDCANLSPDKKSVFVCDMNGRKVWRLPLDNSAPAFVTLPFGPDNANWDERGRLFVTGLDTSTTPRMNCAVIDGGTPECLIPYAVDSIDPKTMKNRTVLRSNEKLISRTGFGSASVAVPVYDKLVLGSFQGDRILILPRKLIQRDGQVSIR